MKPIEKRIEALETRCTSERQNHAWNLAVLGLNDLRVLRDLLEKVKTDDGQHDLAKLTALDLENLQALATKAGANLEATTCTYPLK